MPDSQTQADDNSARSIPAELVSANQTTVLLVDDQPIIGEGVRRLLLGDPEISFHYCSTAREAIASAIRIQPTVILQDLVMPDMYGLQLLRQYRSTKQTEQIPVIVLSTKEEPIVKKQAFELGASDYLVKLPDRIELIARIRHHSRAYSNQLQRDAAMEALSIALRDKSEFMRIASHDLKNPLTVVLGCARLLEGRLVTPDAGSDPEVNPKLVATILRQVNQMRKLVEDYLDAQAIEDGQLKLERKQNDLNAVARNASTDLAEYAASKGGSIRLKLDDNMPCIEFDAGRLAQVAINFTSNALKFSLPGSEVTIRTRVSDTLPGDPSDWGSQISISQIMTLPDPEMFAIFEVEDSGPGLLPQDMRKLFRRYAKLSAKPTGNEKSTGLGLSICKRLVELHGGRIGAHNNLERGGATFWFALPI